jgi:hypothetical protein
VTFIDGYHTGVVVSDLDAAAEELNALLNVRWRAPRQERLRLWTPAGSMTADFRYTYSVADDTGPMIELIEAGPHTPWWPGEGVRARLHHLGFWSSALALDSESLAASGAPVETAVLDRAGTVQLFAYHQLAHGPRVELVDRAQQADLKSWGEQQ